MKNKRKPQGYWTLENVHKSALLYNTLKEFRENSQTAYTTASVNGWLSRVTSHLLRRQVRPPNYWTFTNIQKAASKCKTKKEFRERFAGAEYKARKEGWLDSICAHMEVLNSIKYRDVYLIISKDFKSAYIGLSCNVNKRYYQHCKSSNIRIKNLLNTPHKLVILKKHLLTLEAIKWEKNYIKVFKERGYTLANISLGGEIGSVNNKKWSRKEVEKVALLCTHRSQLSKDYPGAYASARKNGWYSSIISHLPIRISKKYLVEGKMLTTIEISKIYNIKRSTISQRLSLGHRGSSLIRPVNI